MEWPAELNDLAPPGEGWKKEGKNGEEEEEEEENQEKRGREGKIKGRVQLVSVSS